MPSPAQWNNLAWLPPHWNDWSPPDPTAVKQELKKEFTDEQRADAWDKAAKAVETHHDELVERWHKAMDSVLVYAGLFSAVLTAFNVQSYQLLLQPAPTDPMLAALEQISAQLNSFSINPSFVNSTQPALSPNQLQPPFRAPVSAIWINVLWFASLVCSLASASIALVVKQWLYEESQGLSGTSREAARLRQYRLNSLIKWRVGAIVLVPSLLLQVALFFFLSGLLVLSWTIHVTVAAVITVLIFPLFAFVFITTILPVFTLDCCYRSPQAYGVFVMVKPIWNGTLQLVMAGLQWFHVRVAAHVSRSFEDLVWSCYKYTKYSLRQLSTWHGAEQTEIARDNGFLDRHIATMAYTTTFATEHLETLHIFLSDLPCRQVFACFSDIYHAWIQLWGPDDADERSQKLARILLGRPFSCALRKALAVDSNQRDNAIGDDWTRLSSRYLFSSYDAAFNLPLSEESLLTFSTLAFISLGDSVFSKKTSALLYDSSYLLRLDWESLFSDITYESLKDVMAIARYNIHHWFAFGPDKTYAKMRTVEVSLECTRWALTTKLVFTGEQEAWIRFETRSLLHSLAEKVVQTTPRMFPYFTGIFGQLSMMCTSLSRGHEMVPDEFLLAIEQASLLDARFTKARWEPMYLDLKMAILQQKHHYLHAKRCFHAQQPPAMVF